MPKQVQNSRVNINIEIINIQITQHTMKQVYLLIPLLTTPNSTLQPDIQKILHITSSHYELYQFDDQKYAVELHAQNLGYQQLSQILEEKEQMRKKLAVLESTLRNYEWSFKESSIQANSISQLMKKAKKYKQLKEENKKLKTLMQSQLENTEKVREETQKTIRVLRQEFDTLVKEMNRQVQNRQGGQNSRGSLKQQKNDLKTVVF